MVLKRQQGARLLRREALVYKSIFLGPTLRMQNQNLGLGLEMCLLKMLPRDTQYTFPSLLSRHTINICWIKEYNGERFAVNEDQEYFTPPNFHLEKIQAHFFGWAQAEPGGGHSNPLHYSSLENPMDWGAWQATVQRVAQSWTCL